MRWRRPSVAEASTAILRRPRPAARCGSSSATGESRASTRPCSTPSSGSAVLVVSRILGIEQVAVYRPTGAKGLTTQGRGFGAMQAGNAILSIAPAGGLAPRALAPRRPQLHLEHALCFGLDHGGQRGGRRRGPGQLAAPVRRRRAGPGRPYVPDAHPPVPADRLAEAGDLLRGGRRCS